MKALITSGPTHEPIDPVRFIGNRSSGKQGHAIAAAMRDAGFDVTLVTGPVHLPDPEGVTTIHVTTAKEMLNACLAALPTDIVVCAAAVGDWRVENAQDKKIKKDGTGLLTLTLTENPDILHTLSTHLNQRPKLVIGFAAETQNVVEYATAKRLKKKCDWILANEVSDTKGFDAEQNEVTLITDVGTERWARQGKPHIAERLVRKIKLHFDMP